MTQDIKEWQKRVDDWNEKARKVTCEHSGIEFESRNVEAAYNQGYESGIIAANIASRNMYEELLPRYLKLLAWVNYISREPFLSDDIKRLYGDARDMLKEIGESNEPR